MRESDYLSDERLVSCSALATRAHPINKSSHDPTPGQAGLAPAASAPAAIETANPVSYYNSVVDVFGSALRHGVDTDDIQLHFSTRSWSRTWAKIRHAIWCSDPTGPPTCSSWSSWIARSDRSSFTPCR